MSRRGRSFGGFITGLAVAAATVAIAVPPALGASAPTGLQSNPLSPSNAGDWTFTWGPPAVIDDPSNTLTYEGAFVTATNPTPTDVAVGSPLTIFVPVDATAFRVRSVEAGIPSADYATLPITVDRAGPTATGATLAGPAGGVGGWFRSPLTVSPVGCSDSGGGGAGEACDDQGWTIEGRFAAGEASITLTDAVGNSNPLAIPVAFGYDATVPLGVPNGQPTGTGTLVAQEPVFEWTPGKDAATPGVGSGIGRYVVQFRRTDDDAYITIATRDDDGRQNVNYTATRDPALRPAPLPMNESLEWRVQSIDKAGNIRNSARRDLTIDPTVPPAPTITGGPSAPTRDNGPTFTWTGTEDEFHWDVTLVGAQNPARQGGGPATQTTLAALPDGDYTFRVTQITDAQQGSAEATRSFKVDTTPPGAPTILSRPTFPAIGAAPAFTWSIEPGAYSRWSVLTSASGSVYGPIDTPVTRAELPPLAEGPYTFQVQQIDPAGNVSTATAEGFTLIAPLVPAPTPANGSRAALLAALPKQNALRLQPKAGTTLPTLRPLLRWKKGPRGTKLYNLQIFRVTSRAGTKKPKVTKILSRFPRGRQFRPAKKNLDPGTCYVWRVWPYTGTAFTARPVGVSNFCVAGKKVLRQRALARRAQVKAAAKKIPSG